MRQSKHLVRTLAAAAMATASSLGLAWELEPTKVLGIEMGAPIESVAVCPQYTNEFYITEVCRPDSVGGMLVLRGMPDLGMAYTAYLLTHEARTLTLVLDFDHRDFRTLVAVLVKRYGEPSGRNLGEVTSGAGAKLPSEELIWMGKRVAISVYERSGRIDKTMVSVTHLPTDELRKAERRKDVSSTAEKF